MFVPTNKGARLVDEVYISFKWYPGFAVSQKLKSIEDMHSAAEAKGISPLLEISSKSQREAGKRLSAFNLSVELSGVRTSVECAFQGSKVFERGGPFVDLYEKDSRSAKRDIRLRESGKIIGFSFEGRSYPLSPKTVFYDWLYIKALFPHRSWLERLKDFGGFTDIEFNPDRSINCQARSLATLVAMMRRNTLESAMTSFDAFLETMQAANI